MHIYIYRGQWQIERLARKRDLSLFRASLSCASRYIDTYVIYTKCLETKCLDLRKRDLHAREPRARGILCGLVRIWCHCAFAFSTMGWQRFVASLKT